MRIKNLDLLLAIAIALINFVWATRTSRHPQIIGILLALPQVFLLPGYTLVEICFHKRPLEKVRGFILSLSLSIALIILSGFALSKSAWGLTTQSWASYLTSLIVLFALIGMVVRGGRRASVIKRMQLVQLAHVLRKRLISLILLASAIGMALLAVEYSAYSVNHEKRVGFTQLWLLQDNPTAKSCSVLIGVDSFEFTSMKYHIFITTKGILTTNSSTPITLSPQKTWKEVHRVSVKSAGDSEIQVQLYQDKKPGELDRYVHLILHSKKNKHSQEWECTTT